MPPATAGMSFRSSARDDSEPVGHCRSSSDSVSSFCLSEMRRTPFTGMNARELAWLLAALVIVVPSASARPTSASARTIRVGVTSLRIGSWYPGVFPGISGMVRQFGVLASCSGVAVSWPGSRVVAYLDNPARAPACSTRPPAGEVAVVVLGRGWRTARGLAVGAPASRLKSLYPLATAVQSVLHPRVRGWMNLGVPFVRQAGGTINCGAYEPAGIPCGQLLARVHVGVVEAFAVRVGRHVG
jgi:hypothetical protein